MTVCGIIKDITNFAYLEIRVFDKILRMDQIGPIFEHIAPNNNGGAPALKFKIILLQQNY